MSGCTSQITEQKETAAVQETVAVQITVDSGEQLFSESIGVVKGSTAFQALEQIFSVEAKNSSFGRFITGINGVSAGSDSYWAIYVDEKYAELGADALILEKDTGLLFKLEKISP